ncbi:SDR family NAD(P)-dependent oxidoreductase [Haloferax mediterranei ATCC 33500]|uniref:3-oxoacyl-ACP reductase n=1 Tax=Haloferax mediterranei (strain ATCC 33500 / DSM 1411 / JCM 8866 / NBRC 14739 / NCIMB 2177 / R-4) TaxID=523841 RepID=I3R7I9_HALMT|nr:SDR family NAD(P)-dependent oxidoreductase [Haloferax mediterranei]AFK20199.1 3-oxoacyl-[acyl-carrier protein] reductase (3-ketoacyl-acyl carrier protein reductase) [Haloferax mediterranei ATCC 33500]AHZ23574.1 short-chain dehydrogenase [Haloferax mediterranei ATCC 33500]ELZ99058.1 3-oxoacyl-ACP reductase [Haloferax mediterranei ATCC 33500]MDX5987044.1 SDR family NAD(P)-dependent oxidoreductase [Haloferax mediterranei ATCC 33500]QCQ76362.1 SDR family NAD(P)-dependent oxidoreductase [Halofer
MEPTVYDDLDGQIALVTGANRGIGRKIAENLRDLGATVYAGSRSVTNETPDGTERVLLDVTQEGDIEDVVDGIFADQGRLDILVNNAGIGGEGDDIVAEPTERIDRTLAVNLRGPMLICKHAVPLLLQSEGGRVVNVSSGMGALEEGQSGGSPSYRISKTGLNGLTVYLDGQYGDDGLIANSVCPGWVRTDMGGEEADRSVEKGAETPTWLSRFEAGSPSGKFWRDKEVIDW